MLLGWKFDTIHSGMDEQRNHRLTATGYPLAGPGARDAKARAPLRAAARRRLRQVTLSNKHVGRYKNVAYGSLIAYVSKEEDK